MIFYDFVGVQGVRGSSSEMRKDMLLSLLSAIMNIKTEF